MNMNKQELIATLEHGGFSASDLTEILYAVRRVRRAAVRQNGVDLLPGDTVDFMHDGKRVQGQIAKMNRATALVTYNQETLKIALFRLKKVLT